MTTGPNTVVRAISVNRWGQAAPNPNAPQHWRHWGFPSVLKGMNDDTEARLPEVSGASSR